MQFNNNNNSIANNGDLISFVSARYVGDDTHAEANVVKAQAATAEPERISSFYNSAIHVPASDVVTTSDAENTNNQSATKGHGSESTVAPLSPVCRNNLPVAQAALPAVAYGRRGDYHVAFKRKTLPPRVQAFKERRQRQQAAAAVTGGIVGGVLLGPLGGALVGFIAHGATKSIGRRRQARLEKSLTAQTNAAVTSLV